MGAITKRHQGIRKLRNNVTHIQLTFAYDQECKVLTEACVEKAPHWMQRIFSRLLTEKDFKEFLDTKDALDRALSTTKFVLGVLHEYRKIKHSFPCCDSCKRAICDCSDRYLINEEMNKQVADNHL